MSARTRPPVLRCFRSASTRGVARYFCTWSCRQLGTTFGRSSGVTPTCFGCFLSGRCDWCFPGLRGPDFAPRFPPPCTCHSADGRHVLRLRGRLPYTETCESLARSPRRHRRTTRREGAGSIAGRAGSAGDRRVPNGPDDGPPALSAPGDPFALRTRRLPQASRSSARV